MRMQEMRYLVLCYKALPVLQNFRLYCDTIAANFKTMVCLWFEFRTRQVVLILSLELLPKMLTVFDFINNIKDFLKSIYFTLSQKLKFS